MVLFIIFYTLLKNSTMLQVKNLNMVTKSYVSCICIFISIFLGFAWSTVNTLLPNPLKGETQVRLTQLCFPMTQL